MAGSRSTDGRAAFAAGGLLLGQLVLARALLYADAASVWFAGTRFGAACFFREQTGVPCPTCGVTRSVVLALHGQIVEAFRANPAGPFWVAAAFSVGLALLYAGWRARTAGAPAAERTNRWVRVVAIVQGCAFGTVLAGHWARALLAGL